MAIVKNSIPYAKALFDLAKEKNQIASIKSDVLILRKICVENSDFKDLISNPTISNESLVGIVQKLFSNKLQNETLQFLQLLIKKGRLNLLEAICETTIHFINQEENIIQVKLTTAAAISDSEKNAIATKFLSNQKFEMENIVNPEIIGGFVLEYNNKILDNSVSHQINQFKNQIG